MTFPSLFSVPSQVQHRRAAVELLYGLLTPQARAMT
jgi:hypothetical protein